MLSVSLCVIARNEQARLSACLSSAADLVDEIVVVDTGSTDDTRASARDFDALVFDFPWRDDFAAARNEALRHARGDWVLWLDADEHLDEDNRARLRTLLTNLPDDNSVFLMRCLTPTAQGPADCVEQPRLFRRHPDVRWSYRVHEQILPALLRTGAVPRPCEVVIRHHDDPDARVQLRKAQRNLRLLQADAGDYPEDPTVLFHLGQTLLLLAQPDEALVALQSSLRHIDPDDPIVRQLYLLIVQAQCCLGRSNAALAVCRQGLHRFPDDAELRFQEVLLNLDPGIPPAAEDFLEHLAERPAAIVEVPVSPSQLLPEPAANGQVEEPAVPAAAEPEASSSAELDSPPEPQESISPPAEVVETACAQAPRVSLCMIVQNEQASLGPCLKAVAGLFDEVIVVDTGSTDGSGATARRLGATVIDFPWCDDLAAARNAGLRQARGDWIFWLDADDRLDADNRLLLKELLAGLGDDKAVYLMQRVSWSDPAAAVLQGRLFRRLPGVCWEHRAQENVLASMQRQGGVVRWTSIVIQHTGPRDPRRVRADHERCLRLLRREQEDHPNDPFPLFHLGRISLELDRPTEALPLLRRCLERSAPTLAWVPCLYDLLIQCHQQLGQADEARAVGRRGLEHFPEDGDLRFQEALWRMEDGDLAGAEESLRSLLEQPALPGFYGQERGRTSYLARHHLAELCCRQGRDSEAEAHWQLALAQQPDLDAAWLGLGALYLAQGRLEAVEEVVRQLPPEPDALLLAARLHLAQDDPEAAEQTLHDALALAPDHGPARQELARLRRQASTAAVSVAANRLAGE